MSSRIRRAIAIAAVVASAVGLAGCATASADGVTHLTLWHNYGTYSNADATVQLVDAFEEKHPDIQIDVVSQPQDSYYSLLRSAVIGRSGPDIAVMWTGLYAQKYSKLIVPLTGLVPEATLEKQRSIEYTAPGFDLKNGALVMPSDTQYYIGFYNKRLFAEAGITEVPRTWDELYAACAKLKAKGILPMAYGNGGATGATFVPWYDASYLAAGVASPSTLDGLYRGSPKWTDPKLAAQLARWHGLRERDFTNDDPTTSSANFRDFGAGKAAMIVDGSFDAARFEKALGDDLGVFVPPYSETGMSGVVEFAGGGYSIMRSSPHRADAAAFLRFVATPTAQRIIERNGLIPNEIGYTPSDPIGTALTSFAENGDTRYPMLDNIVQPEVTDVGSRQLPAVLSGDRTPRAALQAMAQALAALPADRKGAER